MAKTMRKLYEKRKKLANRIKKNDERLSQSKH